MWSDTSFVDLSMWIRITSPTVSSCAWSSFLHRCIPAGARIYEFGTITSRLPLTQSSTFWERRMRNLCSMPSAMYNSVKRAQMQHPVIADSIQANLLALVSNTPLLSIVDLQSSSAGCTSIMKVSQYLRWALWQPGPVALFHHISLVLFPSFTARLTSRARSRATMRASH